MQVAKDSKTPSIRVDRCAWETGCKLQCLSARAREVHICSLVHSVYSPEGLSTIVMMALKTAVAIATIDFALVMHWHGVFPCCFGRIIRRCQIQMQMPAVIPGVCVQQASVTSQPLVLRIVDGRVDLILRRRRANGARHGPNPKLRQLSTM